MEEEHEDVCCSTHTIGPLSSAKSRMSDLLKSLAFFGPCWVIITGESDDVSPTLVTAAITEFTKDPNEFGRNESFDEATTDLALTNWTSRVMYSEAVEGGGGGANSKATASLADRRSSSERLRLREPEDGST